MNGISINGLTTKKSGHTLLLSSSSETIFSIEEMLEAVGISTLVANTDEQAFYHLERQQVSRILIDSALSHTPCNKLICALRNNIGGQDLPIIILASTENEAQLANCMSAGGVGILFKPFTLLALDDKISTLETIAELKQLYKGSLNEQIVARRILTNAIDERTSKFPEIDLLLRSKAIFSGDLFLTARHPDGSVNILLADFTGHGLPSAIGALPVADVFCTMSEKGFELGYILENVNNKLHTLLPTSMFMACSVLNIAKDLKQVRVWNGGMPDIYVRGYESGNIKHKIASLDVPLGITETVSNQYQFKSVDLTPGDQIILFTDGLTESLDKNENMFGEDRLEACLQKHCGDKSVFDALINTFDEFRGDIVPMDDITLACIPCTSKLMYANNVDSSKTMHIACSQDDRWHWYMELGGSSLYEMDPVHHVITEIHKISGQSVNTDKLANIMSRLYKNVVDSENPGNKPQVTNIHKGRKDSSDSIDSYVRIGIKKIYHNGIPALLIHMEDSGSVISQDSLLRSMNETHHQEDACDDEFPLVYELNKLSRNSVSGNRLEAIIFENGNLVNNYG